MRYKVSKKGKGGKRIVTDKYWTKKCNAEKYAKETNAYFPGDNARVIIFKKGAKK